MVYRVKTSTKAKRDLDAILVWLSSQGAGEAGWRWFQGLLGKGGRHAPDKSVWR